MNCEMVEIIRNRKPLTLSATATVQEACKEMHERKVGAVLVTKGRASWSASSPVATRCASWPRARTAPHRSAR